MRLILTLAVLCCTAMPCTGARTETLTECGRSDGYAYYFSGGLISPDKSGWRKDGIDGGRIILNFINGEVDLLIKNTTGATASVKQDGGKIIIRKTTSGLIRLTVLYGAETATEDYVFQVDDRGNGTVVFTTVRTAADTINKMSLMTAKCTGPK